MSVICRATAKEKKPSQSRHIFTRPFYPGGFDFQSRRFFVYGTTCNHLGMAALGGSRHEL